ncbi:cytochrome P450 [Streptomyces roseirectus]|uniref:Cytochrome P450 n=1 Tax=Streptomyces roseirectus TaxID=2768066 RepID=A0A7H0IN86_9ACTN|nr:cytochrome P450 [Streptomyces roseirectus]QNP74252.1 cytochrome P450 [Streptomyces roseirectus]
MITSGEVFGAGFWADPHGVYAELRRDAPVRGVVTPDGLRVWVVTRYEDVRLVLADPRLAKDTEVVGELFRRNTVEGRAPRAVGRRTAGHMLNSDPPVHTRLRTLVSRAFTPGRIAGLLPRTEELSATLLDGLAGRGEIELIGDYAFPLSMTVMCELLGLPEGERESFGAWTRDYNSTGAPEVVSAAAGHITAYLAELIETKRTALGDDLLSALVEDDSLTAEELVAMVFLLLSAGHETTVNLIANGVGALLTHPGELKRLRADPALIPAAVEEFLRYDGPVNLSTYRYTTEPVTIAGVEIPARELVLAAVTSANRDGARFPEPDRLDVARSPNRHLSFGAGIHYCLGAPLARQEARVAFRDLLARYPHLELAVAPTELTYRQSLLMRGPEALPLRVREPA